MNASRNLGYAGRPSELSKVGVRSQVLEVVLEAAVAKSSP